MSDNEGGYILPEPLATKLLDTVGRGESVTGHLRAPVCAMCGKPATKEVIATTQPHPVTAGPMCNKHAFEAAKMARVISGTKAEG